jgi:hypothetical protein
MIDQQGVRWLYASHRPPHSWCTKAFLRGRGSNLSVFLGIAYEAEGDARHTPFMEAEDRT